MNSNPRELTTVLRANGIESLREAVLDSGYVSLGSRRTASPHEFYRYPARFSPSFARAAIGTFSRPGDLILDPFVGGGTTLVEARLAGRLAVGSDLNPLAILVSRVKVRPHSHTELSQVSDWVSRLPIVLGVRGRIAKDEWSNSNYFRNIDSPEFSSIKNSLIRARQSLDTIDSTAGRAFARCVLLRAGQWALDMRDETPSRSEFREKLVEMANAMIDAAHKYRHDVRAADSRSKAFGYRRTTVLNQKLPGLADRIEGRLPPPKLILTSPPYPGVYVNYHRWKVLGRRETPAPFWLANELDGNGMSHYTMAARENRPQNGYFTQLETAFLDLARIATRQTLVVQMVGFHDQESDLACYLQAMDRAGFDEVTIPGLADDSTDGRLWRNVPNRRWWVQDGAKGTERGREVVLIHRKKRNR